jgi:hypothetical protein
MEFTLGEFGPIACFGINKKMAIETYYNIRPSLMMSSVTGFNISNDLEDKGGVGLSHVFGCAFRYSFLSAGIEYVYGHIPDLDYVDQYGYFGGPRLNNSCFRVILGMLFHRY